MKYSMNFCLDMEDIAESICTWFAQTPCHLSVSHCRYFMCLEATLFNYRHFASVLVLALCFQNPLKCFNLVSTKGKYSCSTSYKYLLVIFVKLTFGVWPFPISPCEGLLKTQNRSQEFKLFCNSSTPTLLDYFKNIFSVSHCFPRLSYLLLFHHHYFSTSLKFGD